jgi:hypothetical protein
MWTAPFEAELTGVSAKAIDKEDRKVDRATLSLELDVDRESASALPGGDAAYGHIADGDWSTLTLAPDTRRWVLDVLDATSDKAERTINGLRRVKGQLVRKEMKAGDRILLRMDLEWNWQKGELEWVVLQLRSQLRLRLSLQQSELPGTTTKPRRRKAKAGATEVQV